MTCSFALPYALKSRRLAGVSEVAPGWWSHELHVTVPTELDNTVQAWLRRSYQLMGMQERLKDSSRRRARDSRRRGGAAEHPRAPVGASTRPRPNRLKGRIPVAKWKRGRQVLRWGLRAFLALVVVAAALIVSDSLHGRRCGEEDLQGQVVQMPGEWLQFVETGRQTRGQVLAGAVRPAYPDPGAWKMLVKIPAPIGRLFGYREC